MPGHLPPTSKGTKSGPWPRWAFWLAFCLAWNGKQFCLGLPHHVVNLESNCGKVLSLDQSTLVTVTNGSLLPVNGSVCRTGFQAHALCHQTSHAKVSVTILSLNLPGGQSSCQQNRLDVLDTDGVTSMSGTDGLCGPQGTNQTFQSSQDTVYLQVQAQSLVDSGDLTLVLAPHDLTLCTLGKLGVCNVTHCSQCIPEEWDKALCGSRSNSSIEVIVGITIGAVAILTVFVIAVVLARRRKLRWKEREPLAPQPA